MVTRAPIVSLKALCIQYTVYIFDFDALGMVQIVESMLMLINLHKIEITHYCHNLFSYLFARDRMSTGTGFCG